MNHRFLFVGALFVICTASTTSDAHEWTRFRGPNGSGVSDSKTVPVRWTASDYNWKAALPGSGASSPVVWDKRLFVTSADASTGTRFLACLNTADGSISWKKSFSFKEYKKHKNNTYASSTPTVDGDHVYVLWQTREGSPLVALDHAGKIDWEIDLGPYKHGQGGAVSPIVFDELVIVANDHKSESFLIALDRRSGEERWRIERQGKRACYATPCVFRPSDRPPELIFTHCYEGVIGVDPRTGKQNWHIDPFGRFPQRAVGSPVIAGELVIGSSGFTSAEKNVVAIRPRKNDTGVEAIEIYRVSKSAPHVPTPLVYRDWLFLWNDGGIVSCVRVATGESVWRRRVGGTFFASPICVDGRLYGVDRDGEVTVLAAGPEYEVLARNSLGEPTRATPAVSGGVMYLRTDSHVVSLGGKNRTSREP